MSAPLLISADVGQVSAHALETWGNEEVIAVNQQFRPGGPYQGSRLLGGDLFWDPELQRGGGTNVWGKMLPNGGWAVVFVNNGPNATTIHCDIGCYGAVVGADRRSYSVRDLFARKTIGTFSVPQTLVATAVAPSGGSAMLRLELVTDDMVSRRSLRSEAFSRLPCKTASPTGDWGGLCRATESASSGGGGRAKPRKSKTKSKRGKAARQT